MRRDSIGEKEETRAAQRRGRKERAQRFPVPALMRYRASTEERWYEGQIVNVSVSGVLFRTDHRVTPDIPMEIIYMLPVARGAAPPGEVMCRGTVVRTALSVAPSGLLVAVKISTYRFGRGSRVRPSSDVEV